MVVRAAGSESYAGTTITATNSAGVQLGFVPKIPFNVTDTIQYRPTRLMSSAVASSPNAPIA